MTQHYSDLDRENDPYALPNVETFQLTAEECVEMLDEDTLHEYLKDFPLANFNSRDHQAMIDAIIEAEGIKGGWFYWYCFPGCMPDSEPMGPYETEREAIEAARDDDY
jgi:hypothetical protein